MEPKFNINDTKKEDNKDFNVWANRHLEIIKVLKGYSEVLKAFDWLIYLMTLVALAIVCILYQIPIFKFVVTTSVLASLSKLVKRNKE